ncbi:MAG: hypothetical protein ABIP75_09680 [Pyrinomonadaceae bacterium]
MPPFNSPPPSLSVFRPREREVIARCRTPLLVQRWLNSLSYNREPSGETLRSFREVVRRGEAHCLEAGLSAAAILEQYGYPPMLMSLESQDKLDHVIFVFQHGGCWGSVARSRDLGLHGRKPVFRSLRDLTYSYFDPYVDHTGRILAYGMTDLRVLGTYDWRFSVLNRWKVEDHLREIPHRSITSSDARYERLHARYQEFKRRHPTSPPKYYTGQERWLR